MATAYSDLMPIPTVDPNGPYAQALAQYQQPASAPQVNALASPQPAAPAPQMTNALAAQPASGITPDMVNAAIATQRHKNLRDIIGGIGDALAGFGGRAPTYEPWRENRIQQQAFADWQANPSNPQLQANFLASNPTGAFQFQQQRQLNQFAALKAGMELQQAQRANAMAAVGQAATILKGVRDSGGDVGAAYDQLRASGQLDPIGLHPGEHDYYRDMIVSTPGVLDQLAAAPTTVTVKGGEGMGDKIIDPRTARVIATGTPGPIKYGEDENIHFPDAWGASNPGGAASPVGPNDPDSVWGRMLGREGGVNPDGTSRISPKGAIGAAQVMPGTAGEAAAAAGQPLDMNRLEGDQGYNKKLGRAYFDKQVKNFGGDVAKAAAAYNAGPGRVQLASKRYGDDWLSYMPAETQAYVQATTGQKAGAPITAPGSIQKGVTAPPAAQTGDASIPGYHLVHAATGKLDPAAIDSATENYILTGDMPAALGRNGIAQRMIANNVAKYGYSPAQINAIRAANKADTTALGNLGTQSSTVDAAENAAQANGALLLKLAKGTVGKDSIPLFNEWKNAGSKQFGDPKFAAFNAALNDYVGEMAKVVSGGNQASDHQRDEIRDTINSAMNLDMLTKVINDATGPGMTNRRAGFEKQRSQILGRLGQLPKPVQSMADLGNLPKGTRVIDPNGRFGMVR